MALNLLRSFSYVLPILLVSFLDYRSSVECQFENSGVRSGIKFETKENTTAGGSNETEGQQFEVDSAQELENIIAARIKKSMACRFRTPTKMGNLYDEGAASSAMKIWPYKWSPQPHRFLVLHCETGRISNRIICLLNALKYASILNRTLLATFNRGEIRHAFARSYVFDVNHVRKCYGNDTIMTFEEYTKTYGRNITIDQVLCMNRAACPIDDFSAPIEQYFKLWKTVSFSKSGPEPRILEDPKCGLTIEELKEVYGNASGDVLYIGKFFFIQLKTENIFDVPILRSSECHSNVGVQPHPIVLSSAKGFLDEHFKGRKFMAVHLRRDDFKEACKRYGSKQCYLSIEVVVECLKSKLLIFNISDVFLATNTNAEELAYISGNLRPTGFRDVRLVRLKTGPWESKKWAAPMNHPHALVRDILEVGIEKAVCTQSSVFVGSWKSTFTLDIERLRYGFGTSDPRDSYICENTTSSV